MGKPLLKLDLPSGSVLIECWPHKAPKHVAQILDLAANGSYDGTVFHRVLPNFMAQGGWTQKPLPQLEAEFNDCQHTEGTCSMARTNDPNSASDQFFICFNACPWLDGQYTVWGRVIYGMEHVHQGIAKGEPPQEPTPIIRMRPFELSR